MFPEGNNFVESQSLPNITKALALAHSTFCERTKSDRYVNILHVKFSSANTIVLFVVQPNERNIADQRHLEIGLMEKHDTQVVRATLTECAAHLTLDADYHLH